MDDIPTYESMQELVEGETSILGGGEVSLVISDEQGFERRKESTKHQSLSLQGSDKSLDRFPENSGTLYTSEPQAATPQAATPPNYILNALKNRVDTKWPSWKNEFKAQALKRSILDNDQLRAQTVNNFIKEKLKEFSDDHIPHVDPLLNKKCAEEIFLYKETSREYMLSIDPYDETFYWTQFNKKWYAKIITPADLPKLARDLRRVYALIKIGKGTSFVKYTKDTPIKSFAGSDTNFCVTVLDASNPKSKPKTLNMLQLSRMPEINNYFVYFAQGFTPYSPAMKNPEPDDFNTFYGFKAKLVVEVVDDIIYRILIHIRIVWAGGRDDWYHWILSWLSHIVKTPWFKTFVALVLVSEPGSGKDILRVFIEEKVIGLEHATSMQGFEKAIQRFNPVAFGKILVTVNELNSSDTIMSTYDQIKVLITEQRRAMERKFNDPEYVKDCSNWLLQSNHYNCLFLDKRQRRFACPDVSNERRGDQEYFNKLSASLTEEAANHFITYLYNYPGLNVRDWTLIPQSQTTDNMIDMALPSNEYFIKSILEYKIDLLDWIQTLEETDRAFKNDLAILKSQCFISRTALYDIYRAWCRRNGISTPVKSVRFGIGAEVFFRKYEERPYLIPGDHTSRTTLINITSFVDVTDAQDFLNDLQ